MRTMQSFTAMRLQSQKADFSNVGFNHLTLEIQGNDLSALQNESGGHRWQRIPPTERKGRVHTSTVTVFVVEPMPEQDYVLREDDIDVIITKDSGKGGQNRNKRETCVVLTHIPTGIQAKAAGERSQGQNKRTARELLELRVAEAMEAKQTSQANRDRKQQIGSGQRGDKVKTYREKDDIVTNHLTGCKGKLSIVLKGNIV